MKLDLPFPLRHPRCPWHPSVLPSKLGTTRKTPPFAGLSPVLRSPWFSLAPPTRALRKEIDE